MLKLTLTLTLTLPLAICLASVFELSALGQQCPDWSPEFDQIQSPRMKQVAENQRRSRWDTVIQQGVAQGISLQEQIAQAENQLRTLRSNATFDQQRIQQLRGGPVVPVTGAQCDSPSRAGGALMAAQCQQLNDNDMILVLEGGIALMQCRAGGGFHPAASAAPDSSSNELGLDSGALTPTQRGAASVSGLNVAKRSAMVASATRSWQTPNEMQSSGDSLPQSVALADPFADAEVKGSPGGTSVQANSGAQTDAGTRSMDSPEGTLRSASNLGGPLIDSGWSDPLSADSISSNGGPTSHDDRADPVPTQEEIANALNIGVSNSGEASATPVATVANASNWAQFSSSPTSPSTEASASSSAAGPEVNAVAMDATDDQIDDAMRIVKTDRNALSNILSSNEASKNITKQGIEVYGSVAHQMNHVINDADSSGIFSTSSSGNSASSEQIDSDVEGFRPAIGDAIGNAIPGYKYLNGINQDLTNLQNNITKKVESISCLFSFDPYCRK